MNVSQETIDKLRAHMAKNGARGTAKTIIDQRLNRKVGLSSEDLADTATFASGLDEIEALLTQGEYGEAFEVAKDTVDAMLEDEGFGDMFEVRKLVKDAVKEVVSENHPAFPEYLSPGGGGYKMDYKQQRIIQEALSLGKELAERQIPDGDRTKGDAIRTFDLALNALAEMKEISTPSGPSASKTPREPDYEMDAVRAMQDNPNDEPTI